MKLLEKRSKEKFYEINEMVAKTSPMRTHYESNNFIERFIWNKKKKVIKQMLDKLNYEKAIDVGCGDGGLYWLFKSNTNYTGIDISQTQLDAFKKSLSPTLKNRPHLVLGDAVNMPFKDGSFDFALACDILEHVINPLGVMNEIKRIVKHKGYIIYGIPNEEILELARLMTFRFPLRSPDHLYSISVEDIKKYFPSIVQRQGIPFTLNPRLNMLNVLLVKNEKK